MSALSPVAARRLQQKLAPELGATQRQRLDALIALIGADGRIPLALALERLFPGKNADDAQTAFRQFRAALKSVADDAGVSFELVSDGATRTALADRVCWFEGDDLHSESVEQLTRNAVAGARRSQQDAIPLDHQPLRYFISYAHANQKTVDALLGLLKPHLESFRDYRFAEWQDTMILPGENWHAEIQTAIQTCDFGLLLLSPEFLASPYIKQHELKYFLLPTNEGGAGKYPIPVGLFNVLVDHIDLQGLAPQQIFLLRGKSFGQLRSAQDKRAFVEQLATQIGRVINKHLRPASTGILPSSKPVPGKHYPSLDDKLKRRYDCWQDFAAKAFVPTEGQGVSMDKLDSSQEAAEEGRRADAIEYLLEWLRDPQQPAYCALLGEYGMGKTTTCKALTLRLLEAHANEPELPVPVYIDLRLIGEAAKGEPLLKDIIARALEREWHSSGELNVSAEDIIRLVQQEGGLVIFDGLDEVLVHLSDAAGQRFTRELFRILPPAHSAAAGRRCGRMLLTCRTHYFRTLRDQKTHFSLEDRDQMDSSHYRALVLLPFSEAQIETYLRNALPDENPQRVFDTIRAVHNLSEMAERPYTLSLITRHFAQIERWRAEGRAVTGLMLYRHMVQSWLERDTGKHQLTSDHKQALMEHFAAELTRSGLRSWHVAQVEQWLMNYLRMHPEFAEHYHGKDRALLKEDLRTATFLVRVGEDEFRFAHTSLQEFFLAAFLHRALIENRPEDWALDQGVSDETLDFVGQWLVDEAGTQALALQGLGQLRDGEYGLAAATLCFRYFLLASRRHLPNISGRGFQLDGLVWRQAGIEASEPTHPLILDGLSMRGACLEQTEWRNLSLKGADFSGAKLNAAHFLSCLLEGTHWKATDLSGAVFRGALGGADLAQAHLYRTLIAEGSGEAPVSTTWPSALSVSPGGVLEPGQAHLRTLAGHAGWVSGCAFSPDGQHLLSGGFDSTLKLWDAASGRCLLTLVGHEGWVSSCAFSPDGQRLLSGSGDGTLKLWDAASGACRHTLSGHAGWVNSCAFSPDGQRLLSGSDDKTLKLWDAASGVCLLTLVGHAHGVSSCAFSPDGQRLLSGSGDGTLKLWDAASGACLRTLSGHEGVVRSCVFSPDGQRLFSGGDDKTLKLWDVVSGACLLTLGGHGGGVMGCAFSPDGQRLLSGSIDNVLKLWDAISGACLLTLTGHTGGVTSCAFSPDGQRLLSGCGDGALKVWDAAGGACLLTLARHVGGVMSCAFSPDGQRLLTCSSDGRLRVWDAASGACLFTLAGHAGGASCCAFSPDGQRLLSGSGDGTLKLWDVASGACLLTLSGHVGWVWSCAFSPDGQRLLSGSADKTLKLWDAASGACLLTLMGHAHGVTSCAFSPDDQRLLSGSFDGTLKLWDGVSGDCLHTFYGHTGWVWSCAFSPDGQRLLSSSTIDGVLKLWDAANGNCMRTLEEHVGGVNSCTFSPDGQRLLSGSDDSTLKLWDAANGNCLLTLVGHEGGVRCGTFSPDGQRLLSGSNDGTLRQWDARTGEAVGPCIHDFGSGVWCASDAAAQTLLHAQGEVWRYLGWRVQFADGHYDTVPLEYFGPVPGVS